MTNLIDKKIAECHNKKRTAFVGYITAGDPDYQTSLAVADTIITSGADIIELGVPFSDPLADGEANQLAAERALKSGMTPAKVLKMASEIRAKHADIPIVLFTYLNPVAYSGDFATYCSKAVESGVDAILILDLPPDEDRYYRNIIDASGLKTVSLIAPTTQEPRIEKLARDATGFIYYVCREGVTGERKEFAEGVDSRIELIRKYTDLPIVVGFGISTAEHVKKATATGVDGVVVGSAIVRKVEALSQNRASLNDIANFITQLASV